MTDGVAFLGILPGIGQQAQHLANPHRSMIHHDFIRAGFDPSGRAGEARPTAGWLRPSS
jgi:hypothetical protein